MFNFTKYYLKLIVVLVAMLRSLLCFSLIAFSSLLLAQEANMAELKGTVLNAAGQPVVAANVVILEDQRIGKVTDAKGRFKLQLQPDQEFTLAITVITYQRFQQKIKLKPGERKELRFELNEKTQQIEEITIEGQQERETVSTTIIKPKTEMANVSGNLETSLAFQGLGVAKTNELSSSYSVRGGNFDENLVYVNDFEIYRPFLIRSGQQEGLSFSNPNLVESISFSSGGFQAKYGDKMASVLDVTYKKPEDFGGSVSLSMLGAEAHLESASKDTSFTFLVGFRQKTSRYVLGSLDTKGEYSPSFLDFQTYMTWNVRPRWDLELIANYARNRYNFQPVDRETTFGVVNQVIRLSVFFDGQEQDTYDSFMGGFSAKFKANDHLGFKWLASGYRTLEKESFDIIGDYFIGEVETDFSQDDFGDIRFALGTGTIHDWARNSLESTILNGGWRGYYLTHNSVLRWGIDYKREMIEDKLSEWERLDSAFYSLPFSTDEVLISNVLKTKINLNSNRYSGFAQNTWRWGDSTQISLSVGTRFQYWDVNKEFIVTPRTQFSVRPSLKRDFVFTAAAGLYYQPPFYRELRDLDGNINLNLRAQKSAHFVAGVDYSFQAWRRPFKFVSEIYYKHLWDLVPYEFDNVLIRYFGQNQAKGYVAGIDFRLHGELVEGEDSWISLSIMHTQEDIEGDFFYRYYDDEGNEVIQSRFTAESIVDSSLVQPGNIPRPTDQRVNFALFFQDNIPNYPFIKVHLSLLFGSGLPFGPPDKQRFKDTLRIPPYRRVDIGFSARLFDKNRKKGPPKGFMRHFDSIWTSLEIYNLFGINNTVSYLWVKDFRNTVFAVPNFLTNRRINGRVVVKF